MPPMLIAIAADLDASLTSVVQAAGAYFLAYGLIQPVWGIVSDAIGLVRTMRLTLLCAGLAAVACAFAWSPLVLGLTRGDRRRLLRCGLPRQPHLPRRHRRRPSAASRTSLG